MNVIMYVITIPFLEIGQKMMNICRCIILCIIMQFYINEVLNMSWKPF